MLSIIMSIFVGGNLRAKVASTLGEISLAFFQPRAGGTAHVQADLPGIHRWEEIAADHRTAGSTRPTTNHDEQPMTTIRRCSSASGEKPAVEPAESFELTLNASCVRQIQLFSKIT